MTKESFTQETSPDKVRTITPLNLINTRSPTFHKSSLKCEVNKLVNKSKLHTITISDLDKISRKLMIHRRFNDNKNSENVNSKNLSNRVVKISSMKRRANATADSSTIMSPIKPTAMEIDEKILNQLRSMERTIVNLNKVIEDLTRQNNQQNIMITSLQNQLLSIRDNENKNGPQFQKNPDPSVEDYSILSPSKRPRSSSSEDISHPQTSATHQTTNIIP